MATIYSKKSLFTAALAGSMLFVTVPAFAMAGDTYAAIAVSKDGEHLGTANKKKSKRKAQSEAIKQCRKKGKGCKIATWSTRCVALAVGSNGKNGGAWDQKKNLAVSKAVRKCSHRKGKACKIKVAVCN